MLKHFIGYLKKHTLDKFLEELGKLNSASPIEILIINNNNLSNLSDADYERLVGAIRNIGTPITSLSLSSNYSGDQSEKRLIQLLENIHIPIEKLGLSGNSLGGLGSGLINIFKKIPATVKELFLSDNSLNELGRHLPAILSEIPSNITSLTLNQNDLDGLDEETLIRALQAIPPTVKSLDLSRNNLGRLQGRLARVLAAIPPTVTKLSLNENNLNLVPPGEWRGILEALPRHLTELNLELNAISQLSQDSLAELPPTLTTLNLQQNNLNQSRVPLAQILRQIRAPIRILNLRFNDLSQKLNLDNNNLVPCSQIDLMNICSGVPPTVTDLYLGLNKLGDLPVETLVAAFRRLPPNVEFLELIDCNLDNKTDEELGEILHAIPETVKIIDLTENDLHNRTNPNLINILLSTGKTFRLEDPLARELATAQRMPILNEIHDAHRHSLSENRSALFHTFNDPHAEHRVFKEIFEYASPIKKGQP